MLRQLAAFETRVQIRRSAYRSAFLLLVVPPVTGLFMQHGRYATTLFGYAYIASLVFRLGIGVAEDQQSGHDLLLSNFAFAWERIGAKLAALLIREVVLLVVVVATASLVWGNIRSGLWYALEFTLIACLLLPIAVLLELLAGLRAPGAAALLIAGVIIFMAVQNSDPVAVLTWIGIPQSPGSFAALRRLTILGLAGVGVTLLACGSWGLARRETRA